jgi:hypothetical protein
MQIPSLPHAIRAICFQFALAVTILACGGTPGDDEPDATCECPGPPVLDSVTIRHAPWLFMIDPGNDGGLGMYCDEGDIVIGGSCTYHGTDPRMRMFEAGNMELPGYPQAWSCGMSNFTPEWQDVVTTPICLVPQARPSSPEGCDCPEFEPLAERIERVRQSAPYQSYSVNELTVQCRDGGLLLAGGCVPAYQVDSSLGPTGWLYWTLSRSGFADEEATTWHCGWNTPVDVGNAQMVAAAYCLQPPTYGPDPLEGRITRVIETEIIPAGSYASFTASCAPGDFLLSGSCTLDSADPISHEAIMYHHGFDATDPTNWRCAWSNPTTLTLSATATATCVTNPTE